MSLKQLQDRTGCEPRRIKQHLRSLERSAYIRTYAREGTHENDAECFTGIYLLDPYHPNYKLKREKPREVVFDKSQSELDFEYLNFIFTLRERLVENQLGLFTARSHANSGQRESHTSKKIMPSDRAWLNLNWRYLKIVSNTLNKHWVNLSEGNEVPVRQDLTDWLKDLPFEITAGLAPELDNSAKGQDEKERETNFLSKITGNNVAAAVVFALQLAVSIQAILKTKIIGDDPPSKVTVNILPSRLQFSREVFAVEILSAGVSKGPTNDEYGAIALRYVEEESAFRHCQITNPNLLRSVRARTTPENKPRLPDFQRGSNRKLL